MSDQPLLLAFSNPADGREDEFNEWYDSTHLPDVLQVPGVTSGQRYELAPNGRSPHRYLAVYELEGDPDTVVRELLGRMRSGQIAMSDAIDPTAGSLAVWLPRAAVRTSD
jgi:hypothetical protein